MGKTKPIEIKCFDVPDERIRNLTKDTVEILHPKIDIWLERKIVHCFEDCPVCGKSMHVIAIKGSIWLAFCSKECEDKFAEMEPKIGDFYETLRYFRKQRGAK